MAETKSSPFVEYLDKEMNIMGILSVFCVAVSALALDRTAGAAVTSPLAAAWRHSAPLIASGALLGFVAALFFYWERSLLAWYAGQLALAEATDAPKTVQERLFEPMAGTRGSVTALDLSACMPHFCGWHSL